MLIELFGGNKMTENKRDYQICSNCVMDTSDSKIVFDEKGVCDFCNSFYNDILPKWKPNEGNEESLEQISLQIKEEGKGKEYDCILGMSGGVDSSYLCYIAKEKMGLNPLIYSLDSGWNMKIADDNIKCVVKALGLTLHTEVVEWKEMADIQLAALKSGLPYIDIQDHAIFAGLYNYAVKNGIKYVLTGANNATECVRPPIEWNYVNDIVLLKDVQRRFGTKDFKTFPLCGMFKYRIWYPFFKGMKRVAPLDLIKYDKAQVEKELQTMFGWQKYENKHYENIFTRWFEGYYLPVKFGYDKRRCYYSNLILTGAMTREEALQKISMPPYPNEDRIEDQKHIAEKLGVKFDEIENYIQGENKTYKDYKNSYWMISLGLKLARMLGVEKRNFR